MMDYEAEYHEERKARYAAQSQVECLVDLLVRLNGWVIDNTLPKNRPPEVMEALSIVSKIEVGK